MEYDSSYDKLMMSDTENRFAASDFMRTANVLEREPTPDKTRILITTEDGDIGKCALDR
jgi:hypothetical protein